MKKLKLFTVLAAAWLASAAPTAMADMHGGVLDANTATREQLASLPHMDETLADAVIGARPFASILDLDDLLASDLDDDQLEDVYARLFVPISLNSASEEEILKIPGVGARMAHEFEEYRPYSNIEQFRREIGKYVDEEEVARLEQYVTLD